MHLLVRAILIIFPHNHGTLEAFSENTAEGFAFHEVVDSVDEPCVELAGILLFPYVHGLPINDIRFPKTVGLVEFELGLQQVCKHGLQLVKEPMRVKNFN